MNPNCHVKIITFYERRCLINNVNCSKNRNKIKKMKKKISKSAMFFLKSSSSRPIISRVTLFVFFVRHANHYANVKRIGASANELAFMATGHRNREIIWLACAWRERRVFNKEDDMAGSTPKTSAKRSSPDLSLTYSPSLLLSFLSQSLAD